MRHAADAGEVDPSDPALDQPTKPIDPVYTAEEAKPICAEHRWSMVKESKDGLRRVVPSPLPVAILGSRPIRLPVKAGLCVICAGGGGIPVVRAAVGLVGPAFDADMLLKLTYVEAVFRDWGGPDQAPIGSITPDAPKAITFATGWMGPKITAACDFVRAVGTMAGIGRLQDARRTVEGVAGTQVRIERLASENRLPGGISSGRLSKYQPEAVQGPT